MKPGGYGVVIWHRMFTDLLVEVVVDGVKLNNSWSGSTEG